MQNMRVDIFPKGSTFLNSDGTFDLDSALLYSAKIAGICRSEEGMKKVLNEDEIKTRKRLNGLLKKEELSVFDHVRIIFNMQNMPKILNMFLNNEQDYATTEKSLRYVALDNQDKTLVSEKELHLYNKWKEILEEKINEEYGLDLPASTIRTKAQENARYLVSVFIPTDMIHTLSLRQVNKIAKYMEDYIELANREDYFEAKTAASMEKFLSELTRLNVLDRRLMVHSDKNFSLMGNPEKKEVFFNQDSYSQTYKGSFVYLGHVERHRTLKYEAARMKEPEFYVPSIIEGDTFLTREWKDDISGVENLVPQGELLLINEFGTLENLIQKAKQRNCSRAQLETMRRTFTLLKDYEQAMRKKENPIYKFIDQYTRGMACTFPEFECKEPCKFKEGILGTRKI